MVLVIDPIRYCVSVEVSAPAVPDQRELGAVEHAGDDRGQAPVGLVAVEDRLEVLGAPHANASGGGQAQTRLRSPYAWSMRPTGGQYLSGSGPAGNTATSAE